jgi:hypothetical protein
MQKLDIPLSLCVLRGSNLLTFSKFKLWDPEQGGGNGLKYPTQRVFNIGFQMTIK